MARKTIVEPWEHRSLPVLSCGTLNDPKAAPFYVDLNVGAVILVGGVEKRTIGGVTEYYGFDIDCTGKEGTLKTRYPYTKEGLREAEDDHRWLVDKMIKLYNK